MPSPTTQRPRRILELDAVRGLAALAVVLYHYTTRFDHKVGHVEAPLFEVPWGHYGVELFFLLSGFVIFMTLERTERARDFVVARAARLYPGYWVGMLCTLAVVAAFGVPFDGYAVDSRDVALNVTMLQRYVPGTANVDGVYWTLSVELTFYALVLGLFVTGLLRRIRTAILVLLGLELGLHLWTAGGDASAPLALRAARQVLLSHYGPYFGAGILFYRLSRGLPRAEQLRDGACLVACLAALAVMRPGADLLASVVCFAAFGLLASGRLAWLATRPLLYLGAISYSLYVVHQVIGFLVIRVANDLGLGTDPAIALALGLSVALATALTYLVELPAQRWLRATLGRRRGACGQASTAALAPRP